MHSMHLFKLRQEGLSQSVETTLTLELLAQYANSGCPRSTEHTNSSQEQQEPRRHSLRIQFVLE